MAEFVKNYSSSHWYTKDAQPMHSVIGKNGKERKTKVTDARELGLLPSVTTILSLLAKPELENWKIEQAILSSLTLPMLEGESTTDYAKRIAEDAQQTNRDAMDFGTLVHAYIEAILTNTEFDGVIPDELKINIQEFIQEHQIYGSCEVAGADGIVAGKVDFLGQFDGELAIIDWKTAGGFNYYDTWLYQLVAYRRLLKSPSAKLINVVINKTDMSVDFKAWEDEKIQKADRVFDLLTKLFYEIKEL